MIYYRDLPIEDKFYLTRYAIDEGLCEIIYTDHNNDPKKLFDFDNLVINHYGNIIYVDENESTTILYAPDNHEPNKKPFEMEDIVFTGGHQHTDGIETIDIIYEQYSTHRCHISLMDYYDHYFKVDENGEGRAEVSRIVEIEKKKDYKAKFNQKIGTFGEFMALMYWHSGFERKDVARYINYDGDEQYDWDLLESKFGWLTMEQLREQYFKVSGYDIKINEYTDTIEDDEE